MQSDKIERPNKQSGKKSSNPPDALDGAIEKFKSFKRLLKEDQRVAAVNLGLLAQSISPDKPLDGVHRIVAESGVSGILEKRKRFFQLPEDELISPNKDHIRNANPSTCINLARAAGRLLSKSSDLKIREQGEKEALRTLLTGTSFLPKYTPRNPGERSVTRLLDEYATRLCETIEKQTKIADLWHVLQDSPFWIERSSEPLPPSIYGAAAHCSPELVEIIRPGLMDIVGNERFVPGGSFDFNWDEFHHRRNWHCPELQLGYVFLTYDMYGLKLPKDITKERDERDYYQRRNEWLSQIGFFNKSKKAYENHLHKVKVAIFHPLMMYVTKTLSNKICIEISLSGNRFGAPGFNCVVIDHYSLFRGNESFSKVVEEFETGNSSNSDLESIEENLEIRELDDYEFFDYTCAGECCPRAKSITLPNESNEPDEFLLTQDPDGSFGYGCWQDREAFEEYKDLWLSSGWVDDPGIAKILFGSDEIAFIPSIKFAEPVSSVAREGTVAASILQNVITAPPEHQISQMLTKRTSVIADSGLRFYDEMLNHYRLNIANI